MELFFGFNIVTNKKIRLMKCVDCRKLVGVMDGDKPEINPRINWTICDICLQRRNETISERVESLRNEPSPRR